MTSLNERVYDQLRSNGHKALADEFADAFPHEINQSPSQLGTTKRNHEMSTRYEAAGAESSTTGWAVPGAIVGNDTLPPGQYALMIDHDEVFYIQGNPAQLRDFMVRLDLELQDIEAHAEGYNVAESKARDILAGMGVDLSVDGDELSGLNINEIIEAVTTALMVQS